jgi:hypothetical protein
MNAPWGSVAEDEGELGGGTGSALDAMIEFLSKTHLCRLEDEDTESFERAMDERDMAGDQPVVRYIIYSLYTL